MKGHIQRRAEILVVVLDNGQFVEMVADLVVDGRTKVDWQAASHRTAVCK